MSAPSPDIKLLKHFSPFDMVGDDSLTQIASKTRLIKKAGGTMLFKRGAPRKWCHWVVRGKVDLLDSSFTATQVKSGRKNMLDENEEYSLTAVTVEDTILLVMENDALDILMTVDQAKDDNEDWMTRLLQSHLFELIPPANIQALFNKFTAVNFQTNDVVIREGDEGDYFYVVKSGQLKIEREENGEQVLLAEVGPGACFGEDALLQGKPRNATITMLTPGVLMKLTKEDFNNLLAKPAVETVTEDDVREAMASGEQKVELIDVRFEEEINDDKHPEAKII
ncbi:MAG: cyclic nucleotide-binding domain-containing protein, partial [Pseudomonadales bacterium]|nr:cyclic nucleotide-binding domain-containing protein [Pseudomonadales bacterium]